MTNKLSHPLPRGSTAVIYHLVLAKRHGIETRARILSPVDGEPDVYRVRCFGERVDRTRLVHAGIFQNHPENCLSALTRHWEWQLKSDHYLNSFFTLNKEGRQR